MYKFYIVQLVLLVIAITNLARALREKSSKGKVWGVTINTIAIVLLVSALIIVFCNKFNNGDSPKWYLPL